MANNFDLSALALQGLCPSNEILYDDAGYPSIMVKIPKMTYAQLGMGESNAVHPAFIVNGSEIDAIWISKYQNVVFNSRAYSLPGRDPAVSLTFDNALTYCQNKGEGWHCMTRVEWAAVMLWCEMNGFIPNGNNQYGRDYTESVYKAIPMSWDSSTGYRNRVATGTGPLSWSHNGEPDGIWDLKGNVHEWSGGVRTVYGELQVLTNNNAADSSNSQGASSTGWKAISAEDGSLIEPDGSGTTSGSVKMDCVNSRITYTTDPSDLSNESRYCTFGNIQFADDVGEDAQLLIKSIGMAPYDSTILCSSHRCYFNNGASERLFCSGGYYGTSTYGMASFYGNRGRTNTSTGIGFRSAYCVLPPA